MSEDEYLFQLIIRPQFIFFLRAGMKNCIKWKILEMVENITGDILTKASGKVDECLAAMTKTSELE